MLQEFPDRESASRAAADIIEKALIRRLDSAMEATLVVSGGTTPGQTFACLSRHELPWAKVHILPSDERWVPAGHADSNERLVRSTLLVDRAVDAVFQSLFVEEHDVDDGAAAIDAAVHKLPIPFACALLGMGEDGHFASMFPDADNLEQALDTDGSKLVLPIATAASPHARVTLTLAALSRSDEIVLLVFGAAKRDVILKAEASSDGLPVAHLLRQKRAPVRVLWAP